MKYDIDYTFDTYRSITTGCSGGRPSSGRSIVHHRIRRFGGLCIVYRIRGQVFDQTQEEVSPHGLLLSALNFMRGSSVIRIREKYKGSYEKEMTSNSL